MTAQEKIASQVSKLANRRVQYVRNLDGTCEVYCPAHKIVFVISTDAAVTWRAAKDQYQRPYQVTAKAIERANTILAKVAKPVRYKIPATLATLSAAEIRNLIRTGAADILPFPDEQGRAVIVAA
jgi:thiamine monophosphate kinase